ncbi:unnamed protein product [Pseudo-nitzschia multistriata]|uniref:Uncharacterized protein n=1 Tax=Pseudo-nitzschia multistriata TaxID=183589 RepID=A0A448YY23_9STRA|nr:unnamed protein product [Pseudo-nitzschia multistriata]
MYLESYEDRGERCSHHNPLCKATCNDGGGPTAALGSVLAEATGLENTAAGGVHLLACARLVVRAIFLVVIADRQALRGLAGRPADVFGHNGLRAEVTLCKVDAAGLGGLSIALVVQILCWYLQVHLGHQIIEGAQPAVLESLGGALTIAPLFAFYEAIWALGINRELQESTLLLVEEYTRNICSEVGAEATMKACRNLVLEH